MGLLDSDSEEEYSECSEDLSVGDGGDGGDDEAKPRLTRNVSGASACSTRSLTEGTVEERLSALMGLKADIGLEQDPEYIRKEAKKEEIRKAQEEDQKRVASMSAEEKIEHEKNDVGSMMDKIRAKRQLSQKNLTKNEKGETPVAAKKMTKEEEEMAEFRRLKLKKNNSKKKLLRKKSMDAAAKAALVRPVKA